MPRYAWRASIPVTFCSQIAGRSASHGRPVRGRRRPGCRRTRSTRIGCCGRSSAGSSANADERRCAFDGEPRAGSPGAGDQSGGGGLETQGGRPSRGAQPHPDPVVTEADRSDPRFRGRPAPGSAGGRSERPTSAPGARRARVPDRACRRGHRRMLSNTGSGPAWAASSCRSTADPAVALGHDQLAADATQRVARPGQHQQVRCMLPQRDAHARGKADRAWSAGFPGCTRAAQPDPSTTVSSAAPCRRSVEAPAPARRGPPGVPRRPARRAPPAACGTDRALPGGVGRGALRGHRRQGTQEPRHAGIVSGQHRVRAKLHALEDARPVRGRASASATIRCQLRIRLPVGGAQRIDHLAAVPPVRARLLLQQRRSPARAGMRRRSQGAGDRERGIPAERVADRGDELVVGCRLLGVEQAGKEDEGGAVCAGRRCSGGSKRGAPIELPSSGAGHSPRAAPPRAAPWRDRRAATRGWPRCRRRDPAARGPPTRRAHSAARSPRMPRLAARTASRPTRTADAAVPSGTKLSTARTDASRPPMPALGEVGDDRVGDAAAGRAAFVDDEHVPTAPASSPDRLERAAG